MARTGWSPETSFLRCGTGVVTAVPLTISAWARVSTALGNDNPIVSLCNPGSSAQFNVFGLVTSGGSGDVLTAMATSGSAFGVASTSTSFAVNTWFHACGVFTSATLRAVYLNGGGKVTEATSVTPSGIARTSIGNWDQATGAGIMETAGRIAEVAIWNAALTDAEVASLALGVHPFLVRPASLVAYWPLIGTTSPEINLKSSATMAIQGTLSAAAHPRTFYAN